MFVFFSSAHILSDKSSEKEQRNHIFSSLGGLFPLCTHYRIRRKARASKLYFYQISPHHS